MMGPQANDAGMGVCWMHNVVFGLRALHWLLRTWPYHRIWFFNYRGQLSKESNLDAGPLNCSYTLVFEGASTSRNMLHCDRACCV
jgi:hypothetical protein